MKRKQRLRLPWRILSSCQLPYICNQIFFLSLIKPLGDMSTKITSEVTLLYNLLELTGVRQVRGNKPLFRDLKRFLPFPHKADISLRKIHLPTPLR